MNKKEDRAIAPRKTITLVDIVAETLLTLAWAGRLFNVP